MPENLIEHFEDTLHRCESGALRDATRQAMEGTKVYREDFRVQQPLMPRYERRITVENTTTFAAAARFGNQYGVAVLNFANPEVPGGGVKNGATAQEECLCRCSNLYPCLANTPGVYDDFYQYHYEHGRYLYSDRLIYTKGVTVFKNEDLSLKERNQWFRVDVITCAAPILFMLPHTNSAVLGDLFRSRIRNIFNAAIDNDIRVLILGAFGCGAFKNPPEIVAQAFRDVLLEEHYDTCFTDIVFAIKSSNGNDPFKPCPNLMAFQLAASKQILHSLHSLPNLTRIYHRWTRASTVLSGKNAPILRQVPWPYGKYALRAFPCLTGFLLRQNCKAPASDGFSSDFWLLRCRRAGARQGEKDKKRRKDTLSGVLALVHRW